MTTVAFSCTDVLNALNMIPKHHVLGQINILSDVVHYLYNITRVYLYIHSLVKWYTHFAIVATS